MGRRAGQRVAHEALEEAVVDLIALRDQAARSPDSNLSRIEESLGHLRPVDDLAVGYLQTSCQKVVIRFAVVGALMRRLAGPADN